MESSPDRKMNEVKKRKLAETVNGNLDKDSNCSEPSSLPSAACSSSSVQELRSLLDPLAKSQLVDLLSKLGSQYSLIAEEIRSFASADPALRKLFVRGLAWNTTSETLCAAFEVHGEIEEGAVISDKTTGKSRGYGFITYKDLESAKRALNAPSKMIDGRMVVGNLASEGLSSTTCTPDHAQRKLYVGGLSPEITSEMLLSFFSRHGEIEEGSVAYDKETNKSRGFGFVTYKTVEAAKKAVDCPEKILGGKSVMVKLAETHKSKIQTAHPSQPAAVQLPMAMTAAYPPIQNVHSGTVNPYGGYNNTYPPPQPMLGGGGYPNAPPPPPPYISPHVAVAPPYSAPPPQSSYPQFVPRIEPPPQQPSSNGGGGGFPYYMLP